MMLHSRVLRNVDVKLAKTTDAPTGLLPAGITLKLLVVAAARVFQNGPLTLIATYALRKRDVRAVDGLEAKTSS